MESAETKNFFIDWNWNIAGAESEACQKTEVKESGKM